MSNDDEIVFSKPKQKAYRGSERQRRDELRCSDDDCRGDCGDGEKGNWKIVLQ